MSLAKISLLKEKYPSRLPSSRFDVSRADCSDWRKVAILVADFDFTIALTWAQSPMPCHVLSLYILTAELNVMSLLPVFK